MKALIISIYIVLFLVLTPKLFGQSTKDTLHYEYVFGTALKGEVNKILSYLDTLHLKNPKDQNFKTKFENRFKYKNDSTLSPSVAGTELNPLYKLFQEYWRKGLLHPKVNNDSIFKQKLILFFNTENKSNQYVTNLVTSENLEQVYKKFIESKGFHTTGFGKNGKFYDFLVWKTMDPTTYTIDLIDKTQAVTVYFMKDFLSLGWMEYARLGERYPGGWATDEALYCVAKGYDISSEKFKVIYLKHEAQHFSDYKQFPGLPSRDLEYRGKLIEMAFCKTELYNRFLYFLNNAKNDPTNAHPHANYRMVHNMSQKIFNKNYESDIEKWRKISLETMHTTARDLYFENTAGLKAAMTRD